MSIQLTAEQEKLVLDHMAFARDITGQTIRTLPMDFEEAIGAGYEGLVQAAQRWDKSGGASFKTFSQYRIRGAIIDYCRKNSFVGRKGLERGVKIDLVSLDDTTSFGESIVEITALETDPDLRIDFEMAFKTLTPREQKVVMSIATGIKGTELADELGVTESRVSQIATEAKHKLLKKMTL